MNSKVFAGIGSQMTPNTPSYPIGNIMAKTAYKLCVQRNWGMTSGGDSGASTFFQNGLKVDGRDAMDVGLFKMFLPWLGYNSKEGGIVIHDEELLAKARQILIENDVYPKVPRFIFLEGSDRNKLIPKERAISDLHTSRVFQILQESLKNPVTMVVCWTADGAITRDEYQPGVTGGTGIAISLAQSLGIPVFNLFKQDHLRRLCEFIGEPIPEIADQ